MSGHSRSTRLTQRGAPTLEIVRQNGTFTLRRNVEEVVLNVTVVDHDDHLVDDLTKDDFHVWEDNTQQTIRRFSIRTYRFRWGSWSIIQARCATSGPP